MGALTIPSSPPALVLFGRDHAGKPHASWFDAASVELATKAAGLMSMRAVPVDTDELRELATSLPRGRVFSSGRAFTPFVKGKLYERLIEVTRDLLGLEHTANTDGHEPTAAATDAAPHPVGDAMPNAENAAPNGRAAQSEAGSAEAPGPASTGATTAAAEPKASIKPNPRPSRAEEIGPGSTVLATTGAAEGWYEARVIGVNGSTFTLKWADYNEASFVRRGNELGFLPRLPA